MYQKIIILMTDLLLASFGIAFTYLEYNNLLFGCSQL